MIIIINENMAYKQLICDETFFYRKLTNSFPRMEFDCVFRLDLIF